MPDVTAAPAAPTTEPTKIPPPTLAGAQGAAALVEEPKSAETVIDDPYEFDGLEVKGQKQKLKFASKDQLKAILQKALYSDQVIKDATQAKKGAESLMQKLKTSAGIEEVLSDPDIGVDVKEFALGIVRRMMDDERLTPEQRDARDWKSKAEKLEAANKAREDAETARKQQQKTQEMAQRARTEIIDAMKAYPDIPQTQATMDAIIQNMRAAYKRFGKHLTPQQAMSVYSEQYWKSAISVIDKMDPEQLLKRFGQKTLDKIQQFRLQQLKQKTDPSKKTVVPNGDPVKKKKNMTEKEYERHFQDLAGGL